jgi:copper transport protein
MSPLGRARAGRRWDLAVLVVLGMIGAWLTGLPDARAHAIILESVPRHEESLSSPKRIVLRFNSRLEKPLCSVQLVGPRQKTIALLRQEPDAAADTLSYLVPPLEPGAYQARWKVMAADGHVTEGSVPFGVGVAATTTSLIPPLGAPDPATASPPPLDAAVRWLNLLAAALAFGGLPFALLVWRPALRAATKDESGDQDLAIGDRETSTPNRQSLIAGRLLESADDVLTRVLRRLIVFGGALFLLANLLFLLTQAATAAGVPLAQALGAPVLGLLGSRTGQLILVRCGLTLLIVALAWRLPPAGRGAAWPWWVALALAGGSVLTISMNAHGAAEAQGAALAIALDRLHIAAMIAWLGGLLPLLLAIRAARRAPDQALPLALLIPRFSRLAITCVVLLTLTGTYSYFLHINRLDLLAATTYGRALLIKLGLFGLLFLLGAVNLVLLSPWLKRSGNRLARAFGRSVRAELLAGALLLLAVGAMTSVAPSKTAWQAHEQLGLSQAASDGAVDLVLRVAPAQIGDNEWAVDVTDKRPGAAAAAAA